MRTVCALLCAVAVAVVFLPAASAEDMPAPPPAPSFNMPQNVRIIAVGPKDSVAIARKIKGKFTVTAVCGKDVEPATVDILLDDKPLGSLMQKPFKVELDTNTIPDGEHTLKAIGRDADGKDIWSAATKVEVVNSRPARPAPAVAGPEEGAAPAAEPLEPDVVPAADPAPKPEPAVEKRPSVAEIGPTFSLEKTYSNDSYGISIQYPTAWVADDKTPVMKPKTPGGVWLAFGTHPVEASKVVVNVRRMAIEPTTDADTFARYNTYVQTWERKTVLGHQGFATTSGTPAAKEVIHRLIVIADGFAWMFNCTDKSGSPASQSRELLQSMVNTLKPLAGPRVKVTEVR